ncbi:MAG: hypothetical protein FJ395_11610 [Verrucomicrobia bacterium]|nr:hypothetical protein [Verrucomicrobiota bacterium]
MTSWSVYRGEGETGFTFHLMDSRLDTGPILMKGSIPIRPDVSPWDLEWQKAAAASVCLPGLLDVMAGRSPGTAQEGQGRFYSQQEGKRITTIADPSVISFAEFSGRLRAFGVLYVALGDRWHRVSAVRRLPAQPSRKQKRCFQTSEGYWVEITRFRALSPRRQERAC